MSTDAELIEQLHHAAKERYGDMEPWDSQTLEIRAADRIAALIAERDRLKEALAAAKVEIEWWVQEHSCCLGHENDVMAQMRIALSSTQEKATATCEYCGQATADGLPAICMKCYAAACENAP
jgi:hypothetical protein